ncbi:MAG: hypothetical protein QXU20_03355 [Candidatus Woesearchaeota archaeon]
MKVTVLSDGHGKNGSSLYIQFHENSGLVKSIEEKTPILLDLGPGYEVGIREYIERIGKTGKKLIVLATHTHADHFCPQHLLYEAYTSGIKELYFFGPAKGEYKDQKSNENLEVKSTSNYLLNALNTTPITGNFDLKIECNDIYDYGKTLKSEYKKSKTEDNKLEVIIEKFDSQKLDFYQKSLVLFENKNYLILANYGNHVIPTISGYSIIEHFLEVKPNDRKLKELGLLNVDFGKIIKNIKDEFIRLEKRSETFDRYTKFSEIIKKTNLELSKEYGLESTEEIIHIQIKNVKFTYITDTSLEEYHLKRMFQNLARESDLLIVGVNKLLSMQKETIGKYHISLEEAITLKDASNSKRLALMHFPWPMQNFIEKIKKFYTGLEELKTHQKEILTKLNEILLRRNDIFIAYSGIQYEILPNEFKVKSKKWMK